MAWSENEGGTISIITVTKRRGGAGPSCSKTMSDSAAL